MVEIHVMEPEDLWRAESSAYPQQTEVDRYSAEAVGVVGVADVVGIVDVVDVADVVLLAGLLELEEDRDLEPVEMVHWYEADLDPTIDHSRTGSAKSGDRKTLLRDSRLGPSFVVEGEADFDLQLQDAVGFGLASYDPGQRAQNQLLPAAELVENPIVNHQEDFVKEDFLQSRKH
jgi:hypothetical protein